MTHHLEAAHISDEMHECIDRCSDCHDVCVATATVLPGAGRRARHSGSHPHAARLRADVRHEPRLHAPWIAASPRDVRRLRRSLRALRRIVRALDDTMRRCAEECRRCAESCRSMSGERATH